jgi:hypothetical protein
MLNKPDIRFKSSGSQTAQAELVVLPLSVRVNRPSGEVALGEVRRVVDQFRQAAEQLQIPGARLSIPELANMAGKHSVELTIEQVSKKEVQVAFLFAATLSFDGAGEFWDRALAIAAATDYLQAFTQRSREKDVEVDAQQGKILSSAAAESRERAADAT